MFLSRDRLLLKSIRTKIAFTTFITISIVLLFVSSTLFFYFQNVLRESIFQQQFTLVSEIAEQLNGRIELARNQLYLASTSINRAVLADKTRIERELLSASPAGLIFDAGFLVIGTDGQVISESMGFPELIGTDLSLREYVRRTLTTGKPVISVPFQLSIPPNPPLIAMVLPVRDDSDRIICLLAGYHTLGNDEFLTRLSSKRVGAGGYLYLMQGRTILSHPDSSRILEEIPNGTNRGIDFALQGFEGSLDNVNSKGQHMLSSFKRVGDSGWILGANIPYDAAFAPLKKLAISAGIIASVGILFSLVVLWYVARRVTLPITVLSSHLTSIGTDKLEWQPLTISTGDEIELLSEAFNTMMKEVHDTKQLLKDEKNFFGGIIQNAAAPIFVIDQTHTIIFWNSALAILTGKSSFQMVGTKQQWTPFYPNERPVLADLVVDHASVRMDELYACHSSSQLIEGSQRAEGWYDNLGGKRRFIFFEAAPIKNKNNEIIAAIETLEDITDRKLAEEATASHHSELEQLFGQVAYAKQEWEETLDHLRDYIILTDSDHRIKRCNKLLAEDTGRPVPELIGRNWMELIGEAGFTFVTFNGTTGEIFNKRAERSYDVNVYPINVPGKLPGHVVSINDTTELRAAGQELEKAFSELKDAQLQIFQQEKMASIGQLAAGVAHEINNPMGFISSNLSTLNKYVDRLAEFIAAGDELLVLSAGSEGAEKITAARKRLKIDYVMEDSRQLIAESLDGAARVRRIVQDLKSFSRVDLAECALINLNEALDTTINIAWNEIKYVATLNREFGDIPPIKCFPQQINQVFLNLLVNAAHAIGENQGTITVRTWSEGDNVLVSVTDSGCGIPAEIRQKIFEPFFTTKEVGKGTGLGLSISYDIIRKHGGEITVESEIGVGTTFIVKLPVEPPAGGETA